MSMQILVSTFERKHPPDQLTKLFENPNSYKASKILLHNYDSLTEQNLYGQWLRVRFNRLRYENESGKSSDLNLTVPVPPSRRPAVRVKRKSVDFEVSSEPEHRNRSDGESRSKEDIRNPLDDNIHLGVKRIFAKSSASVSNIRDRLACLEKEWEVREYIVEKQDIRLIPTLRLQIAFIAVIVILWSFSCISTGKGVFSVLVVTLWAFVHAWNCVVQETLIVTRTLGIQIHQLNVLGKLKYAKFVPIENIKAVVINEIIRRQRVISYLLILLEAPESTGKTLVPALIGTLPRLRTIEKIYEDMQNVIF